MIINMFKPEGWTSFDVVKKVRNITKFKKVGHGGTLDPFASGILIIATENDTKNLTSISALDKKYIAVIQLGQTTDTLDIDGKIILKRPIPKLSFVEINEAIQSFRGPSEQIPPMYSAKHYKGKRLYTLARKGIVVKRAPSKIDIEMIKLISYDKSKITFEVKCSKGTYIRVLGENIAKKLHTVGYLSKLERIQIGDYHITNSISIDNFEKKWKSLEN